MRTRVRFPPPPPIQAAGIPGGLLLSEHEGMDTSPTNAAYIAGLSDGEGTATLTREHSNENRRLVVSISSTERALLDFVREAVGAGHITNKRTYRNHHTPIVFGHRGLPS